MYASPLTTETKSLSKDELLNAFLCASHLNTSACRGRGPAIV